MSELKLLQELKVKPDKFKAAIELREYISGLATTVSKEQYTKTLNDLNRKIFELVHSSDSQDKLSAIYAIDALIDIEGEDTSIANGKISRCISIH